MAGPSVIPHLNDPDGQVGGHVLDKVNSALDVLVVPLIDLVCSTTQ